jgi:N-acetylglucosamine kinase-like BadF-type ATPase
MYFLAIDAGGPKTEVAVGDEQQVLSREVGGSIKIPNVGAEAAGANLREVVVRALSHAGLTPKQIDRSCVGMSGISRDDIRNWLMQSMAELMPSPATIVGDQEIAHYAAFSGEPGVLVIAGTGSIAIGKSPDGKTARCGGWGPKFSDEGSAYWIGELAARKLFRMRDRGEVAPLLDRIVADLRLASADELVTAQDKFDFATLFPTVCKTALEGDLTAWFVLSEAGRELADMALAVAQSLRLVRGTVCGAGSVFRYAPLVRSAFRGALAANAAHLSYDEKLVEPVLGALAMARKAHA